MADKIRILLVEDSPSDVRLTQEALLDSKTEHELNVVNDGEQALNYLRDAKEKGASHLPDVILLDLNMPRKNGHEVMAEIKLVPEFARIPVILLTVSQQDKDIMDALKVKMNYYLSKPVESQKLSALLKAIFELHADKDPSSPDREPTDEDFHVRLVLAGNPHTTAVVLQKLSIDDNFRIRCRVAENPNTPAAVLTALSRDESAQVRLSVAENENTPPSVLQALAKDTNDDVRMGMAENPNIPQEILNTLAADENVFVADSAKKILAR